MNYNQTIVSKVASFINYLVPKLDDRDDKGRELSLIGYKVIEEPDQSLSYYIDNELTYSFEVQFDYLIKHLSGKREKLEFSLTIPKKYNGIFIINGKKRFSSMYLGTDMEVRVKPDDSAILLDSDREIILDDTGYPSLVKILKATGEQVMFNFEEKNLIDNKNLLVLTEKQKKKLQVKLNRDIEEDYFSYQIVLDLHKRGDDNFYDNIVDKKIVSIEDSLLYSLYRVRSRQKILRSMRNKFHTGGIIYPKDIQRNIMNFFVIADETSIEIPNIINPLSNDALSKRIELPTYIAYNRTFTDIIDVVNTPENNNVNRLNELNSCVELVEGEIHLHCYKISGEKSRLLYLDYLNERVLTNHSYDYENNCPKRDYPHTYKFRLHEYPVSELSEIKFVEPKRDDRLSVTTRRIPLMNHSDSVRVAMGAAMARQAVELENPEIATISTGHDREDTLLSSLNVKSVCDGVIRIEGENVFVDAVPHKIPEPITGVNGSMISFIPRVSNGDQVMVGDVLIWPKVFKDGYYQLGLNALVGYAHYKGYTYEDGIVISESFAKKLARYVIHDVVLEIRPEDVLSYLKPVGIDVKSLDTLIGCRTKMRPRRSTKRAYEGLEMMRTVDISYRRNDLIVPNNITSGVVVDYKIIYNDKAEEKLLSPETLTTIKDYELYYNSPQRVSSKTLPESYMNLKCSDQYEFKSNKISAVIKYKIVDYDIATIGTKLANRWGSKGEVSLILPDDQMPYTKGYPDRRLDVILNPDAIIARKNISQLYEVLLNQIREKISDLVCLKVALDDLDSAIFLMNKYFLRNYDTSSKEEFLWQFERDAGFFVMEVGCYSRLSLKTIKSWIDRLTIELDTRIIDPEIGEILNPIVSGRSYMMRLYHGAEYSGKVTSSYTDRKEPHMGKGFYRKDGQKFGEMEVWALIALGTHHLMINKQSTISKQYEFINNLMMAGYTILDEKGLPMLSDYRDKIKILKHSEHVK
jgi:DNA-directed RNA polymerase, beta subunit/140 kD subunit